jgi:uncharacterized membrane protein YkvA (DUF1232 family)
VIETIKRWARALKSQLAMALFVGLHPSLPRGVRWWWMFTLAYALSPIDLIPDFIPVLGFVDEMILLPIFFAIGFALTRRFAPQVLEEAKNALVVPTAQMETHRKLARAGMKFIVIVWCLSVFAALTILSHHL